MGVLCVALFTPEGLGICAFIHILIVLAVNKFALRTRRFPLNSKQFLSADSFELRGFLAQWRQETLGILFKMCAFRIRPIRKTCSPLYDNAVHLVIPKGVTLQKNSLEWSGTGRNLFFCGKH